MSFGILRHFTFTTIWANSANGILMILFLIFPRKQDVTFHANCLRRIVASCFLKKQKQKTKQKQTKKQQKNNNKKTKKKQKKTNKKNNNKKQKNKTTKTTKKKKQNKKQNKQTKKKKKQQKKKQKQKKTFDMSSTENFTQRANWYGEWIHAVEFPPFYMGVNFVTPVCFLVHQAPIEKGSTLEERIWSNSFLLA